MYHVASGVVEYGHMDLYGENGISCIVVPIGSVCAGFSGSIARRRVSDTYNATVILTTVTMYPRSPTQYALTARWVRSATAHLHMYTYLLC
ncbi:hypothetical protein FA95DRAFT_1554055 [Auriscalpium vulgare]|uniref:Uncharacterized protein n=1 Tax=Auriscalpium vulgare TaxID=40419 RepID=A0ACB8S604_9AGAM|nr:hypothetical protein FA95DRAFT_1554055 [Auriscalpium vulgare]